MPLHTHALPPAPAVKLHVVVRRARNLTAHDLNGKNDPYVKLRLGQQTAVTRVQLGTNSPVWNEHFVFGVSSVEAQQLHLMVYDYDKFKHDDFIGACHIGLSHLPVEEVGDTPFELGGLEEGVVDYGDGNVGPQGAEFPAGTGRGPDADVPSTAGTRETSYGGSSDANDDARSGTGTGMESEPGVRLVPSLANGSDSSDVDPNDWGRPASPQGSVQSSKGSRRRSRESSSIRASLPWARQVRKWGRVCFERGTCFRWSIQGSSELVSPLTAYPRIRAIFLAAALE